MKKIVQIASGFLGTREGSPEFRKIIDLYNEKVAKVYGCYRMKYTDPWCAAFVSLCAALAGITDFPFSAACQPMYKWGLSKSRYQKNPGDGWLVLYDWDCDGVADHVGIVEGYDTSKIYTIEGNTSDSCARRIYSRSNGSVMGFVRIDGPDTGDKTEENTVGEIVVNDAPVISKIGVLRKGSKGAFVSALQWLLVGRGFSVGRYGCDGDFGDDTRAAVMGFQALAGIAVDGEAGPDTFKHLVI